MGTGGSQSWQWSGPCSPKKRITNLAVLRKRAQEYSVPARNRLGPKPKCIGCYSTAEDSKRIRQQRRQAGALLCVIRSQLLVAKRRAPNPNADQCLKSGVEAGYIKADVRDDKFGNVVVGSAVFFVKPRGLRLGSGKVLCFPDRRSEWCALDVGWRRHRPKTLQDIVVVPVKHVLIEKERAIDC